MHRNRKSKLRRHLREVDDDDGNPNVRTARGPGRPTLRFPYRGDPTVLGADTVSWPSARRGAAPPSDLQWPARPGKRYATGTPGRGTEVPREHLHPPPVEELQRDGTR